MKYKKPLALLACASLLLGGCAAARSAVNSARTPSGGGGTSSSQAAAGGTVSGIITKVNGKDITGTQDLSAEIEGKSPGDTVELEVYRPSQRPNAEGKFFTVTVALMEDLGDSVSTQGGAQNPSDAYGRNPYGNGYDDYGDSYDEFEDFFNQFFG